MNRIRIGRPGARSERPWPGGLSPDPPDPDIVRATGARPDCAFRKAARDMMAWVGGRLWLVVRTAIRAVGIAHHEQVRMWECILETSGAAPLTAAGPLRWVPSLDGYRLIGSHRPAWCALREKGASDPCPAHARVAKLSKGPESLAGPGIFPGEFEANAESGQRTRAVPE